MPVGVIRKPSPAASVTRTLTLPAVPRLSPAGRMARAVVITDGDVQELPSALAEQLRRARPRVRVGLLDGSDGSFCARLGWSVTRMPALDILGEHHG